MASLTPEKIAELKAANGTTPLNAVAVPGFGDFVFKKPSRTVFDQWRDGLNDKDKKKSELSRQLAQNCLVFPTWDEFVTMIDALPAVLANEVVDACLADTGIVEKYEVKKL